MTYLLIHPHTEISGYREA